jgi:hypothetical protein
MAAKKTKQEGHCCVCGEESSARFYRVSLGGRAMLCFVYGAIPVGLDREDLSLCNACRKAMTSSEVPQWSKKHDSLLSDCEKLVVHHPPLTGTAAFRLKPNIALRDKCRTLRNAHAGGGIRALDESLLHLDRTCRRDEWIFLPAALGCSVSISNR